MAEITSFSGKYRFLSNFYPCKLVYDYIEYPSSEHAFVAHKTKNRELRLKISKIQTPGQVKRFGRSEIQLREDWGLIKINVMRQIVEAKFEQNDDLMKMLMETKGYHLIEGNTWGDRFWGESPLGNGRNELGKILMSIRDDVSRNFS